MTNHSKLKTLHSLVANHEAWYQCPQCQGWYDKRVDRNCPDCGKRSTVLNDFGGLSSAVCGQNHSSLKTHH